MKPRHILSSNRAAAGITREIRTCATRPAPANSVAIQSDGNIVVGGFAFNSQDNPFPSQLVLARYIGLGAQSSSQFCLRDDTSPITMQLTEAGDYTFKNCATGQTLSGSGSVRIVNNVLMLTDNRPDRRIRANFFLNQLTGSAIITLIPAPGVFQTIRIIDTVPNASCSCQ